MDTHHGPVAGLDPDIIEIGREVARTQGLGVVQELMKMGVDPLDNPAFARLVRERPGHQEWCDAKFLRCSPAMFLRRPVCTGPYLRSPPQPICSPCCGCNSWFPDSTAPIYKTRLKICWCTHTGA